MHERVNVLIFNLFFVFVLCCLEMGIETARLHGEEQEQSCTELPPISQRLLFVQTVLSSSPHPIAVSRSVETCCVCQSSTNFEGRKLITGNGSILHHEERRNGKLLKNDFQALVEEL